MTRKEQEQDRYFRHAQKAAERELDRKMTLAYRTMIINLSRYLMENVIDYRSRPTDYPIHVVLMTIIIGIIFGANDVQRIEDIAKSQTSKVLALLGMVKEEVPNMPSDTTMLRILSNLDDLELLTAITEWSDSTFLANSVEDLRNLAIDGKAIRAALEKLTGRTYPPFILNAFDGATGALVSQMAIDKKTNELGVLPELLERIGALNGVVITTDAFASHPHIMKAVTEQGGIIIMPSKGNQGGIHVAVNTFIRDSMMNTPEIVTTYEDADNGKYLHGRISYRTYSLIKGENVGHLFVGSAYEGLAKSVGFVRRVTHHVRRNPVTKELETVNVTVDELAYILNTDMLSVEQFGKFVRKHWSSCEVIHYLLDNEFGEDQSRVRTGFGMQNLSLLRKVALTIVKAVQVQIKLMSIGRIRGFLLNDGGIASILVPSTASAATTEVARTS